MLLLAGGSQDPNILRLISAAAARGVRFGVAFSGVDQLLCRVGESGISINNVHVTPTAVFARFNVFGYDPHNDASQWWKHYNWHTVLMDCLPKSKTLNDRSKATTKLNTLRLAAEAGFSLPETVVAHQSPLDGVCKPVHGGHHTQRISRGDAVPWGLGYCQEYLPGPEYRIYVIGDKAWRFEMQSPSVDYREKQDAVVTLASGLEREEECVRRLMGGLGLRFAAADLRADAEGRIKFLEINDGPMFSAFDSVCDGQIADAIIDELASP